MDGILIVRNRELDEMVAIQRKREEKAERPLIFKRRGFQQPRKAESGTDLCPESD